MTVPSALLDGSPFVSYSYAYPHKTAYRRLYPAVSLGNAWQSERQDSLFLYLHVPFCEYRCGFCNLFTQAAPAAELPIRYLGQLRREAEIVRSALPESRFVRLAIGGGTPTFLDTDELADLFSIATGVMGAEPGKIPVSIEASPATVSPEKLALLREFGVDRLSLGVQTFDDAEARRLGRPQQRREVERALGAIRDARIPTLNIDLIYGAEGQTVASWLAMVRAALDWQPEELYLYPLYVRELTGLGRLGRAWDDERLALYRAARNLLLERGYLQVSLRMFRGPGATSDGGVSYCCQADGMVGLGCGARSYTGALHYSTEFATGRSGVAAILAEYLRCDSTNFAAARHGIALDDEDRRRRFVILSLLQREGVDRRDFARRFAGDVLEYLPQVGDLEALGLAIVTPDRIRLTDDGIERSDAIGPWLYS
ncbi:MAG TPA: STM4012 family radical SAM protein, partial [Planctomycetaceae bacterium]